nr:interferon-induced protein 44-like [Paramormyrops kingsleyae]
MFGRSLRKKLFGESTPKTVEEKPELLDKPWRNIIWDTGNLKQSVQNYAPNIKSVPQARILLVGAIGAGKSSFFNSINSVFRGNITGQARAGISEVSQTTKYRAYQVKAGRDGPPLAFLLCDTMGVEHIEYGGVNIEDIDSVLKGHIQDKYTVRTVYLTSVSNPQNTCSITCETFLLMFLDVPLLALLTQVDKACPHVEKDLKNVYRSCFIKEQIYKVSDCLGIPVSQVLPVKNYSHEIELDDTCDILLLIAMQQMLNFADNYFDNFSNATE